MVKTNPDGSTVEVKGFGGKGMFKDTPQGIAYMYNNEKSFYHGSVVVGTAIATAGSAYATAANASVQKAQEAAAVTKYQAAQETSRAATAAHAGVINNANRLNVGAELGAAQIVKP